MLSNEVLAVVGSVRNRTRDHVSIALPDLDALTIALAAGSVDADALIEYMHEGVVRTEALAGASSLALSDYDFTSLYGRSSAADPLAVHARILEHEASPEAKGLRDMLEEALITTLKEDAQGKLWRRNARALLSKNPQTQDLQMSQNAALDTSWLTENEHQ